MTRLAFAHHLTPRLRLTLALLLAGILLVTPGCDSMSPGEPPSTEIIPEPEPEPEPEPTPEPEPEPTYRIAVGAAYPNAGDSRIILINDEGTRFVYWNPNDATFSDADDIDDLENGQLPFSRVGASASTRGNEETFFFDDDGELFTKYERDDSAFDEVEAFGDDDGEFGDPEIEDIGAAVHSTNTNRIFFFNKVGTKYAVWDYEQETWTRVYDFASEFGGGGAPIASVGAAVRIDNAYYLFNRNGTQYTIYSGSGTFSAAFDLTELGDGTLSFDD